jgi:hypothetical protein
MKTFRRIDLFIQAALMISFFPALLFEASFPVVLALGGWQLFSFLITHFFWKQPLRIKQRKIYASLLGLIALPGLIMMVFKSPMASLVFFGLLCILPPFMAVGYFYICCKEVTLWKNRSLIQFR